MKTVTVRTWNKPVADTVIALLADFDKLPTAERHAIVRRFAEGTAEQRLPERGTRWH